MKINRLRSIIKEAVDAQLKEIEAVAENAAMEARLAEYDKAIKTCEIKIETAENLEEVKDLMDEGKINELKKKLKSLTKAKEKLGWVPEITVQEMCAEMVREDWEQATKAALLKKHGYKISISAE